MGKRLKQQRRGKGSIYRAPTHRSIGKVAYPYLSEETQSGKIVDLVNSTFHSAPLMVVEYDAGNLALLPAPEGVRVGQSVSLGEDVEVAVGNTLMIKDIPAGTLIYNLEKIPGDGGKFVRTSGLSAQVVGKEGKGIAVKLPSKRKVILNENCLATVGIVAGAGRTNKPFVKAGNKFHAMKARGIKFPTVRGKAMNAFDHPHGGTHNRNSRGGGKYSTTRPRNLPPGKKVGAIAARRTGKKK